MIPLPQYYPEHKFRFVIFATDPPDIVVAKEWFNNRVFIIISKIVAGTGNMSWIEYVTSRPEQLTKEGSYWGNYFKQIVDHYK